VEPRPGPPDKRDPSVSVRVPATIINNENEAGLERLAALATAGEISSVMDRLSGLAEAADAVRHLAAGKVVITV